MRKTAFILDFTSAARAEKQKPDIRIKEKNLTSKREVFGAPAGTRILDPLIKSQMLYQLSYGHIPFLLCVYSLNSIPREKRFVNIFLQTIPQKFAGVFGGCPCQKRRGAV